MKKVVLSVAAALAVAASAAPAFASDLPMKSKTVTPPPPPPYALDIAVGGIVQTDYLFRGISQSDKGPSGGAYFEPDLKTPIGTFYVGIAGYSISWPSNPATYGFTDPAAEIDFYGGWRNSWGPFSLDIGIIEYYYPSESFNGFTNTSDFYEIYGKVGYDFGNGFSIGGNVYWTPDLLHYSETFAALGISNTPSAVYYSGTAAFVFPQKFWDITTKISGELGYWDIESSGFILAGATANPSYTYWNAGISFAYKELTLDLRYYGTDQSAQDCANFLLVGLGNQSNSWCDDRFVAALKFDTSVGIGH